MDVFKKFLFYLLLVLSTGLITLTMLSLIYDAKIWYFKIIDFPRIQYLLLGILFLLLIVLSIKKWKLYYIVIKLGLLGVILIHGTVIYPYYFGDKTVLDFETEFINSDDTFSVILANVLVDNRQSDMLINIVNQQKPDILLTMEVDDWWINELQVLKEQYPYHMEYPLDNAYGLSLYSKLPMKNKEINFLKHDDVPSFHIVMTLPSGQSFNFYGIHPVAPVPSNKYPDNVGEEAVELLKIGSLVADNQLPSIVAGDFNDVSWSFTSKIFNQKGKLNNVRIGRGLYNTFNANSLIMRWPLDHYFVTKEFKLIELERLAAFGSDHYPLYAKFVLEPQN